MTEKTLTSVSWTPAGGGVVKLEGLYVARTNTWEGPGRYDYAAALADLRDQKEKEVLEPFGPKYPQLASLEKWRRAARFASLEKWEKQLYGEAVGVAILKLQRSELMSALTPTPSLKRPGIPAPPSITRLAKYSKPNPFPMVGDPRDRDEQSLYEQLVVKAVEQKQAA